MSQDGGSTCAEVLLTAPPDSFANVCNAGPNVAPAADNDAFTQTLRVQTHPAPGVLAGDSDPNSDPLSAELVGGLTGLTLNLNGSFSYDSTNVPDDTTVTFTYTATDGTLDSNVATVTLTINRTGAPNAVNDAFTTVANTSLTMNVDANDNAGGDPGNALVQATLTVRSQPANGTAVVVNLSGDRQITYTPAPGFTGVDTFTYTINDNLPAAGGNLTSNIATVTVTVDPAPPNGSTGLVAAYGFNEASGSTVMDSAIAQVIGDGANNGTFTTGVARVAGRPGAGNALSFNGSSGMVTIPDAASLDLTRMTISAWVNPTTALAEESWRSVIVKERVGGLVYALYSNSDDDGGPGAYIRRAGASSDQHAATPTHLVPNEWAHLAATYDGAVIRLYVNGTLRATFNATGGIAVSGQPLRIGGNTIWSEWFAGAVDDVRIHNYALPAQDIVSLMNTPIINP